MSSPPTKAPSPAKSPASPGKSPSPAKSPSSPTNSTTPPAAGTTPAPEATPLAVDENPEEDRYDLGIDVGSVSDTASLRSSILKYREENGRTYHAYKDGSYAMPNDEAESERLDLQHAIFLQTFDSRLLVSKLEEPPKNVFDACCGTGIWSIEFADENPESTVTGVDLSPIQPAFVPPNCHFYVDDVEDDWTFSTLFDLIFARLLTGAIKDFPRFFKQAYDNLAPGGAIEIHDCIHPVTSDDGTLTKDSPLAQWSYWVNEGFRGKGSSLDTTLYYEEQLADAGFVDIGTVREKWPSNCWPKDKKYKQLGLWGQENFLAGLYGCSVAIFTRPKEENGLGWTMEEFQVLLAGVRDDLRNTDVHAYIRINAIYARKPMD